MRSKNEKFIQNPDQIHELDEKETFIRKEQLWNREIDKMKVQLANGMKRVTDYDDLKIQLDEA